MSPIFRARSSPRKKSAMTEGGAGCRSRQRDRGPLGRPFVGERARVGRERRCHEADGRSATISKATSDAKLAQAQAALNAQLTTQTLTSGLPVFESYHSYDLWRAQAEVENARRYAVTARRAIEAKYLSTSRRSRPRNPSLLRRRPGRIRSTTLTSACPRRLD